MHDSDDGMMIAMEDARRVVTKIAPELQELIDNSPPEALASLHETHHYHRAARAPRRGQGGAVPGRRHRDLADPRQRPRGRAGDRRAVPRHHGRHGIPRKSEDRNGVLRAVRAAVHRRHPVFRPHWRGRRRQDLRAADRARHPHPHGRGGQRGAHGSQPRRGPAGGAQTRTTRRRGSRGRGGGIMRLPLLALDAAAISGGDTAWVLTSTALVMVMTVGLAFFYGGLVRPKNALNTMMMSVVALGLISVQWVLFGYSIAFGHGSPLWGGLAWLGFSGVGVDPDPAYAATIPLQAHAMFQLMFAIITPALISGAIVERMRFRAYGGVLPL